MLQPSLVPRPETARRKGLGRLGPGNEATSSHASCGYSCPSHLFWTAVVVHADLCSMILLLINSDDSGTSEYFTNT